jgi:hypothetical protein
MAKLTLTSQPMVTAESFDVTELRCSDGQIYATGVITYSDGSTRESVQVMSYERWPDVLTAYNALVAKVQTAHAWQETLVADHGQAYIPAPPAPAVVAAATSVTASWEAVAGATEYKVAKSSDGGVTWDVPASVLDTTKLVDGLTADTEYVVAVSAVGSGGEGPKAAVPVRTAAG